MNIASNDSIRLPVSATSTETAAYPNGGSPVSVHIDVGISPLYQRIHWHKAPEINLIQQGKGYYIINGNRINFKEGDIILISSESMHRAYAVTEDIRLLVISYCLDWIHSEAGYDNSVSASYAEAERFPVDYIPCSHPSSPTLQKLLKNIYNEHSQSPRFHSTMEKAMLMIFLSMVGRKFALPAPAEPSAASLNKTQLLKTETIIRIMEAQFDKPWSLQSLSAQIYMSPSHFRALFHKVTGCSPLEYLIQVRISRAVEMLESAEGSVSEIAAACGFRSISNFNRLFIKNTGKRPSDILRQKKT